MYQILIPKNRNLVIFQNERFKLWDYSKLESLMQPWPQFADKQFAIEWVNYFLCKISLIFQNEYDIDYANAIGLKNLDTNEILLFWCKEVMFNSADKKNVTLTLVMDVFSKNFLQDYKIAGVIKQTTLPECRYYFKDNKLVFDNANIVYDEGFQFAKTSSSYEIIYDVSETVNSVQHLFYITNNVVYPPLHAMLDKNYPTLPDDGSLELAGQDKAIDNLFFIWESNNYAINAYDASDTNVLKVIYPTLYFSMINIGQILGTPPTSGSLAQYNGVDGNVGININGLKMDAMLGSPNMDINNEYITYTNLSYNGNQILIKFKNDFYNGLGISAGLITLYKKDLSASTYKLNDDISIDDYMEDNYLILDELVLNNSTYISSGKIVVSYWNDNTQDKQILIGQGNYQNTLAGTIWDVYRTQYLNFLKLESSDEYGDTYNSSTDYTDDDVYKYYIISEKSTIGSGVYSLNDLNLNFNNKYMYQFKSVLYNDENYDIKLSLSSQHNKLMIIASSFNYEISSYENYIFDDTLVGYLQEYLVIGENNKISIIFKDRDNNKYINVVDCYDFYLKKSSSYNDYMLSNGSEYMTSKSFAQSMENLSQQLADNTNSQSVFDVIGSFFTGIVNSIVGIFTGGIFAGVGGMIAGGAKAGTSSLFGLGDSIYNQKSTNIQNQMMVANAQNAVNMLNAKASDLKRTTDNTYNNTGFNYLATIQAFGGEIGDILLYKITYNDEIKNKINWFYKIYGWKNGNQFELTNDVKKSPKFDYIEMENIFTTGIPIIWIDMIVNFFKAGIWFINDETIEDINAIEFKDNILYE